MLGNQNHKNNSSVDEDSPATIDPTASPQTTSPTSASTATTPPSTEASEPASPSLGTSPSSSWSERPLRKSSNRKNSLARDLIAAARNSMHGVYSTGNQQKESFKGLNDEPQMRNPGVCNNSAGESIPGPRSTFRVGVTEDRNKKCRKTMEDTHAFLYNFLSPLSSNSLTSPSQPAFPTSSIVAPENQDSDNGYFAIFDGHAGSYAADWCGRKLHVVLEETIRKNPDAPIPELLDMTFTNCDSQLEKLPVKNSGCTAVCAVLRWEDRPVHNSSDDGKVNANIVATVNENTKPNVRTERQRVLYTANVGDARIVMCRNGKALRLSYDHKGSDENEGKRVTNAGGLILNNRVNGVLAVTRALGDSYMKELVTGHPYTTESILQNDTDEFLILACDGVWDVCSDQEAVDLICNVYDPQEASKILVDHALSRFSTDNLSCMIVRLDPSGKFENIQTSPAKTSNGFEDNGKIMSEVDEHQHIGPHQGFGVTKDITLKLPPAIKEKADKAA